MRPEDFKGEIERAMRRMAEDIWARARLAAYPVGSYYISESATSPAELFGGTWERIEGRFLLAATDGGSSGASQAAGNTGGEAAHALTPAETAIKDHSHTIAHTHTYSKPNANTGGTAISVAQMPSHNHGSKSLTGWIDLRGGYDVTPAGGAGWSGIVSGADTAWSGSHAFFDEINTTSKVLRLKVDATHTHTSQGSGQTHSHSIGTTSTNTGASSATSSGGQTAANGSAHNNMPPYIAVYVWKRTA